MVDVFLLLGSNLGTRGEYLQQAELSIESLGSIIKKSAVYETQSWGIVDEPDYLNQVLVLQTTTPATVLLRELLNIETGQGRRRAEKWGPRIIDIDILFYGDKVIDEPGLAVPHPRLHQRRFALEPLTEIAPEFLHPVFKKTIAQLKNELNDNLKVKKL